MDDKVIVSLHFGPNYSKNYKIKVEKKIIYEQLVIEVQRTLHTEKNIDLIFPSDDVPPGTTLWNFVWNERVSMNPERTKTTESFDVDSEFEKVDFLDLEETEYTDKNDITIDLLVVIKKQYLALFEHRERNILYPTRSIPFGTAEKGMSPGMLLGVFSNMDEIKQKIEEKSVGKIGKDISSFINFDATTNSYYYSGTGNTFRIYDMTGFIN